MNITDPIVLRNDVVLLPVADLPAEVREKITFDDGDYTLSRRHGRAPSQVIDGETASLLKLFRQPCTIVDAVIQNSRTLAKDPESWLDELLPHLGAFLHSRVLVPVGSEEEREFDPSFQNGAHIDGWAVLHCVNLIEDSEIYRVKSGERDGALKIARHAVPFESSLFGNEADVLRRLGGGATPELYGTGLHEERPYLIMEWCAGSDAATAAAQRRHDRSALLEIACGIVDAYAALHEGGVIHGDVHPRNVIVGDDGRIRLIDFGLAAIAGERPRVGRGGMYYFFEPEYLAGQRQHRHDDAATLAGEQYSIAALLYLLITNEHYLDFRLERDEMVRQVETEPPLPFAKRGIAPWPDVEAILGRALEKDPAKRFATTRDFAAALHAALDLAKAAALATPLSEQALAFAEERLRGFTHGGARYSAGFTEAPTASINFGSAGAAVGLLRVAEVRSDPALLALAEIWKSRAVRDVGNDSAWYNEELELSRQNLGEITPYHTESGVHAAAALIAHARGDLAAQSAALRAFLTASSRPCAEVDLTLGKSATLIAGSLLLDLGGALPEVEALKTLGNERLDEIWRELDQRPPIAENPPTTFLGMAHGWCGYLYAALRWCAASGAPIPAAVPRRLDELAALRIRRGHASCWQRQVGGHAHDILPGWCNGAAGFVYLWTAAYDAYGEERYLRLAEESAAHAGEEPPYTADLCCGAAGRAYALLNLYRHTGSAETLSRARRLANAAADFTGEQQRTDSLWKGELGIAVLIADLQSPENARMPFFE